MSTPSVKFLDALECGYTAANCAPERGLLLAISGGVDSVALLHATVAWLTQQSGFPAESNGNRLVVAHVNHRLRGERSEADAEFVGRLAEQLELPFELLTIEEGSLQLSSRGSLEEACRKARYQLLGETAQRLGFASVATAHHMDDQAETILHNVIRGTGLRGLAGMQPSRPLRITSAGNSSLRQLTEEESPGHGKNSPVALVRPMLNISRADIEEFVAIHNHEYREDHTNRESAFTRNRIRNELLPLLARDFNPQVAKSLVSLSQQAAYAARSLDRLADDVLNNAVLESNPTICRLDASRLQKVEEELLRHALARLWTRLNWPRQKMTFAHWQRLSAAILAGRNTSFQLPGGIDAIREGDLLRLTAVSESS
ncbi:tRNA lysidine(34) synthetase TilS [Fuerstiella marisgermanici]|uniref:tRNA(Ile)-lysidine synthase n=1 Tax=Fuerstiella marisgermanici TaxID=1891926 RepID=A0A1P8WQ36_9PLAN|nr:tRNA lysidine(34) synthetase TilS [Fuerstiella marisgermanici]APZ96168.1 tRNA(Ile)-lysidine synthase [Fuerstiella marisgermanici]